MSGIMCVSVNLITNNNDIIRGVYILSISLIPYTLAVVCQSISRAFEKMEHIAVSELSGNCSKMVVGVFVLMKGYGILELMFIILASQILISGLSLYFALKCIRKPLRLIAKELNLDFSKWMLRASPVFAVILIVSAIRLNIDISILTKMMGEIEVGYYSAASKLVTLFKHGMICYIMAIQPVVFRLYATSSEKFETICRESIRYIFIITFPIIFGTMVLSEHFIILIFRQEFLPSALALRVIIWVIILFGLNQIFANALIAGHKQNINLHANLIGMAGNIALNVFLIPPYAVLGAAVANVASAFIILIYQYYFVSRYLFEVNYINYILKPFISSVVMGGFLLVIKEFNLLISIPISAVIYIICLLALRTFSKKDLNLLRKLWKGERGLSVSIKQIP
jgi:O-antigen/teichoic acid export membrane protein